MHASFIHVVAAVVQHLCRQVTIPSSKVLALAESKTGSGSVMSSYVAHVSLLFASKVLEVFVAIIATDTSRLSEVAFRENVQPRPRS